MQIAIAQLNQVVGDLAGNARAILAAAAEGERAGARLVVTPELSLCGYPPEDLLLRPAFLDACAGELAALAAAVRGSTVLVGFPEVAGGRRYNALAVLRDGRVAATYRAGSGNQQSSQMTRPTATPSTSTTQGASPASK